MPMDDGQVRWVSEGVPELRVAFVPRDEITFTDGWFVQGLKGTGSYDYNAQDVFIPSYRTMELFTREPLRGTSAATRMGLMPVTAAGHASWALGVAKSMLDDVEQLAATKVRMSDMATLASRPTFQKGLAHHVAAWRAARLLVLDAFTAAEASVAEGNDLTPRMRADMRVAAVYATDTARACVEWAHLAAGTTSIREGSRLERAFRDMYTGTQHAFISEKVAIDVAQIWLGINRGPVRALMVGGRPAARPCQSVSFINSNQALASPPIIATQLTGTRTKSAHWTPHSISTPASATPPAVSVDGFTAWRMRATGRGESLCWARRSRAINAMATNTASTRSSLPRTHSGCTGIDQQPYQQERSEDHQCLGGPTSKVCRFGDPRGMD